MKSLMHNDLESLNAQFGLADQLRFVSGEGGLAKAVISNALADAEIYLHGGHLTHFAPKGQAPVIWMSRQARFSSDKPIRGGAPVVWPWFGAHESDSRLPQHGFARVSMWTVAASEALADGATRLSLALSDSPGTRQLWPHGFKLCLDIVVGDTLQLALTAVNTSDAGVRVGAALHTYFVVADIARVYIDGFDGVEYLDKPDHYARKRQQGVVRFNGEVDRIYLATEGACEVVDSVMRRRIIVSKRGSASTVIWNPWEKNAKAMADFDDDGFNTMVCVESANAADDVRYLAPGQRHTLLQHIALAPL